MSSKAKSLAYERPDEPAFLARMRAQVSGSGGTYVSSQAQKTQRVVAARNQKTDVDEAPTIVDENGNILNEDDVEALEGDRTFENGEPSTAERQEASLVDREENRGDRAEAQEISEVGANKPGAKKRKAPRLVVDEANDDQDRQGEQHRETVKSGGTSTAPPSKAKEAGKQRKKKAGVQLSFDTDS